MSFEKEPMVKARNGDGLGFAAEFRSGVRDGVRARVGLSLE